MRGGLYQMKDRVWQLRGAKYQLTMKYRQMWYEYISVETIR